MKVFKVYRLYFAAVTGMLMLVHTPFGITPSNGMNKKMSFAPVAKNAAPANEAISSLRVIYDSLNLSAKGLSQEAFDYAIKGYSLLKSQGKLKNDRVLSIVDFTKSSAQKRLFVLDVNSFKLLFHTYVAHGQNTGQEFANQFSNKAESHQSSLGFYVTTGTYMGKNGFSMQLNGMENGFNDQANVRAIVMHGAPYVSESFIKMRGYIGRSHGCPAVPEQLNKPIIDKIKDGSCLFIYSNNKSYLSRSRIINS